MLKKFHAKNATTTDSSSKNVKSKSIKSVIKSISKSTISTSRDSNDSRSSKSKWKIMRPTATGFSKKTSKKSSRHDIIKNYAPKLDERKLFEGCHNMKNMKTKPKDLSKSKSKSTSATYSFSDYDDDTYVEDMTNAFAIILPEYMIRCTDECDTVFEKIEDIMRPKNFPHSNYNRNDDDATVFEQITTVMHPARTKIKTRKLKTMKQPIKSTVEIVGKKNIIMNDKHGEKIRVVATIQKGGDDNPLANVTTANKYSIVKSDKPASKLIKKSKESVMETWEDQYGNKISLTDDLKKLKVTTEEALRKSEDKEVIEKRVKRTNRIVAISREEAMYKMELKNKKMKFETKEMDDNKLLDILKASKVDELDVQYTQYSDDLSSQTNLFEMKKQRKEKKHTTTTPTKQIIEKSKIPLKEITGTQVKLTSTETSMSTVPDKCQQLQLPDVKQSEIEVNSISQKKVIGKERSTEVEKNEENVKEDEKKMSQNVDEDEVVSEYLTTPLDYYLRGQLANRPSEYDDTTHNPGDRLR